jgi:hypothetical protein
VATERLEPLGIVVIRLVPELSRLKQHTEAEVPSRLGWATIHRGLILAKRSVMVVLRAPVVSPSSVDARILW